MSRGDAFCLRSRCEPVDEGVWRDNLLTINQQKTEMIAVKRGTESWSVAAK